MRVKVRQDAPAWLAVPGVSVFLWLLFGFRPVAIVLVVALTLVLVGYVWPLERGERIVRLHR